MFNMLWTNFLICFRPGSAWLTLNCFCFEGWQPPLEWHFEKVFCHGLERNGISHPQMMKHISLLRTFPYMHRQSFFFFFCCVSRSAFTSSTEPENITEIISLPLWFLEPALQGYYNLDNKRFQIFQIGVFLIMRSPSISVTQNLRSTTFNSTN